MDQHGSSRREGPRRGRPATNALAAIVAVALLGGCGNQTAPSTSPPSSPATSAPSEAAPSPSLAVRIEQPPVPSDVPIAPDSERVDLELPTFSNPTMVTNPFFPVSRQGSVLMLGKVDGKPFRTEVTLLPFTRIIVWEGRQIETLVSQYLAYLDGRITEIAYDLYAQADDGSVWYFGEDVADFTNGAIVTKEGTWLAGKDAPGAMIMAGDPKVGDVFRTENSPGFAFEEVTVKTVDQTVDGPLGPVPGGLIVSELHMDGTTEDKTFAPGYGEFLTTAGGDVEALALAVPTDAAGGTVPAPLETLSGAAWAAFDAAEGKDWTTAAQGVAAMRTAWATLRSGGVPRLIEPRMTEAIDGLARAVDSRSVAGSRQAALDVTRSALDLQLRYRPVTEVNLARFDMLAAQVLVDVAAKDIAGINADAFTLGYVRDRILGSVDSAVLGRINTQFLALQVAATDEDLPAAIAAATRLREIVASVPR